MYRQFADGGKVEREIAASLNAQGKVTDLGRPWTRGTVHQVLSNEKYIGNNVYNHRSFKLKKKRIKNSPDMWIRADGAFEAVVDPGIFYTAQGMIRERNRRYSETEMLERLKRLFEHDLPPRLVPVSSLVHAQHLTSVDLPVAPQTRRVNRRGVARSSVAPAACIRARCAA